MDPVYCDTLLGKWQLVALLIFGLRVGLFALPFGATGGRGLYFGSSWTSLLYFENQRRTPS